MKRSLFFFCSLMLLACLDYQSINISRTLNSNYYPHIEKAYVRPELRMIHTVEMGTGCKVLITVPPIKDLNGHDQLFYVWFWNQKLLSGPRSIEPENRENAVITLTLEESLFKGALGVLPQTFFKETHVLEFYVSDRPYDVPETRYKKQEGLEDSLVWFFRFNKTDC